VADATSLSEASVSRPLADAQLVVDASAGLEYPRLVSSKEGIGRHVSVFLTPNGNSSVLLAEDLNRGHRLRTLEAQYYRAVIQNSWGAAHLNGLSNFRSGASCRDISVVMPYSKIMAHASTLAEQVQYANSVSHALIKVWSRDPHSGAITFYDLPVHAERKLNFGNLELYFDLGVEIQLRELRNAALPNETGGVLLGYFDLPLNMIYIVGCIGAPPDSKATSVGFERGTEGLAATLEEISRRTAGIVGYIGEWHSHPKNHSTEASRDDLLQLVYLTQSMADDGLPAVQLIVGETDIQIIQGKMC
jgi:integrative and conjugative element protein (TIGR02256 family)